MATSSSSRCICLGLRAPSRLPDLASLPEPVRLVAPENPREFLDSACTERSLSGFPPAHASYLPRSRVRNKDQISFACRA